MLIDYHMHSLCSWDGREPVEAFCRRALELGIAEIALTPHAEFDPREPGFGHYRHEACRREVEEARERCRGRLRILLGVEVSYQAEHAAQIADFLRGKPFDLVIGSIHRVGDLDYSQPWKAGEEPGSEGLAGGAAGDGSRAPGLPPGGAASSGAAPPASQGRAGPPWSPEPYLDALDQAIDSGLFDIIGHLDVLWRAAPRGCAARDAALVSRRLAEAVDRMVRRGVGLEINTSGLYQPVGRTFPPFDMLGLYRRLGGSVLTVGSDAHVSADLGRGLAHALEMARRAGFETLSRFWGRQPQPFPLPTPAEARVCPAAPAQQAGAAWPLAGTTA